MDRIVISEALASMEKVSLLATSLRELLNAQGNETSARIAWTIQLVALDSMDKLGDAL